MADTLIEITHKSFGVAGVTQADGTLAGIITDGDLRRNMDGLLNLCAGDVMTRNPTTIAPDALAEEAVAIMNQRRITCLFVVDPTGPAQLRGLLHIHDCLRVGLD